MGKLATKAEERTALAKIKEIVEGLGESSYIAIAMTGMWELIEENINDDFGNSHADMIAYRDKEIKKLDEALYDANDKLCGVKEELNNEKKRIADLQSTIASDNATIERLMKDCNELNNKHIALHANYEDLKRTSEAEIIRLKAKLYDYMSEKEEKGAK